MATIREAAAAGVLTGSRQEITLITPGWGSSGYYSPAVLEQAAKDRVFPAKTQMHIDHDGEMSRYEQPAGSLTRFAAGLTEDARWEPNWVDPDKPGELPGRLVAEAKVMPNWREFLHAASEFIGTSVSSSAAFAKGEVDGRKGNIVEALIADPLNRVDYVTVAGRGGKISAVLESANRIVAETVADDVRQWLRAAVQATHATGDNWAYLEAHNDQYVFFGTDGATYQQAYTLNGVNVTLTGDPVEVRRRVEYDPVTPATEAATDSPANPAGVHENKKEAATMATTQIEEAELATLRESASRAVTVEAELTEAKQKLAAAESASTKATAERIIAEAFGDTEAKATRRALLAEALGTETFDPEALKANAIEAAAEIAVSNGAGTPRGVGQTITVTESGKTITSESIVSALHGKVA